MINSRVARVLLYLPAMLFEFAVRARIKLYENNIFRSYKLRSPVISVGNLTVGGTGKTPCVAYLTSMLEGEGLRVAIISRGYKRKSSGRVLVSDGRGILCTPEQAGDEPYLLARLSPKATVIVDVDRYAAGIWAEEHAGISIIILDDAYQHLRLTRDLNIALIDAGDNLEELRMIPFGRLREPLNGLSRANAVIVTRSDKLTDKNAIESTIKRFSGKSIPIFFAEHKIIAFRQLKKETVSLESQSFTGQPVAVFSGIARPERLLSDLENLGMKIVLRRDFKDHHRYSLDQIERIIQDSIAAGAVAIITTEKDEANLPEIAGSGSTLPIFAARLEFICSDGEELKKLLLGKIAAPAR
ncbi:MAG: tetraacyldisaccharide 4'-kinase [Acidobacteria bacterium]|nr:tetraacyldisaccharide 4'-kinase [Acidobacteriota bacterium]